MKHFKSIISYSSLTYSICSFITVFVLMVAVRQTDSPAAFNYIYVEQQWFLPFMIFTAILCYIIFSITKIVTPQMIKKTANKALEDNNIIHDENKQITIICETAISRKKTELRKVQQVKIDELKKQIEEKKEQQELKQDEKVIKDNPNRSI